MRVPEHCTADAGMFFDGHPAELIDREMDGTEIPGSEGKEDL